MRLLVLHPEAKYFAGAERMLITFLEGFDRSQHQVTVALVRGSKLGGLVPNQIETIDLEEAGTFSVGRLKRQVTKLVRKHQEKPFDLVHGWAGRDWELTALLGQVIRRPAVGTLHDHPQGPFITQARQSLMRWCARLGLRRVVCVSHAVRDACLAAGYPAAKLAVVHNGLPPVEFGVPRSNPGPFRLGFLGVFSERKGLALLFEMLDRLALRGNAPWELHLAGEAQDHAGREMLEQVKGRFAEREWWGRIRWHGWIDDSRRFLAGLDLLVFPSAEFDPFPTVLLEAAQMGIPALAARVGGVAEIIAEGETGWLFDPNDPREAVTVLERLVQDPEQCHEVGKRARQRMQHRFPVATMVADYCEIYAAVLSDA